MEVIRDLSLPPFLVSVVFRETEIIRYRFLNASAAKVQRPSQFLKKNPAFYTRTICSEGVLSRNMGTYHEGIIEVCCFNKRHSFYENALSVTTIRLLEQCQNHYFFFFGEKEIMNYLVEFLNFDDRALRKNEKITSR